MTTRLTHLAVAAAGVVLAVSCGVGGQEAGSMASSDSGAAGAVPATTSAIPDGRALDPNVELVEYGFSIYSTGDGGGRSWAVILDNPTFMTALDVAVTVSFTSLAGSPVVGETAMPHMPEPVESVSETEVIPYVPPGRSAWSREQSGGALNMGPEHVWSVSVAPPVAMAVEVETGGWRAVIAEDGPVAVEPSSVDLARATGMRNPRWTVSAVAQSRADAVLERAAVVVVFRDTDGQISGGARWQAPCLKPHDPTAVVVRQGEPLEDEHVSAAEVFVLPYGRAPLDALADSGTCR